MAFQTTRWSLIARAGCGDADGARALDELCGTYWPPVYALYRREGLGTEAARDLTQDLFADLLERGDLARADPDRGRFRAFLATCARNFLGNHRDRIGARKRGGDRTIVPLDVDVDDEEERLRREPVDRLDPAALFDRRWAQTVIENALDQLRTQEFAAGRGDLFELLRPMLEGSSTSGRWAELASGLDTTEGALKVAAHRLRRRFRERLEAAVRDTLGDREAVGTELEHLLAALGV